MLKISLIALSFLLPLANSKVLILNVIDSVDNDLTFIDPPPHTDYAKMARWLVHNTEWTAMGTISTLPAINGFPMVKRTK
jgi:Pyridoxamine 5'-phosphate oxidase